MSDRCNCSQHLGVCDDTCPKIIHADVCFHKNVIEIYGFEDQDIPPDHPTHYQCTRCGDTFPLIGDDDLWEPKVIMP